MSDIIIKVEGLSKLYRLGEIGTGTLSHDINRWWARIRGKDDPFAKIGETNDRTAKGSSDYVWSLKDVNFEVNQGEAIGIIGRNGAGKSTLLKILSKVTTPTQGQIKVKGRIASLLEVGTGFHPELTGRENIYLNGAILGMTKSEIKKKFDEIVDFAGVERYIDTPVKRYSSGMYVRLAFAIAAFLEPEILIVDEVLAVGDIEFQKKCLGRMKDVSTNDGRTVLFVSHNMSSIKALCDRSILLKNGSVYFSGTNEKAIEEYMGFHSDNIKVYEKGLKKVKVTQEVDTIKIMFEYDWSSGLEIPHLGFVVSDTYGVPVFGSNPTIDNVTYGGKRYYRGTGIVEIKEPRLLDGTYYVSIFFGDGKSDMIIDKNALTLQIVGMSFQKQFPTDSVGYVFPVCKWHFQENNFVL